MFWKLFAGILILIGSNGIGINWYLTNKNHLYHLYTQKKILVYIEEQIRYFYKPSEWIVAELEKESDALYAEFFRIIRREQAEGKLLTLAWENAVKKMARIDYGFQKESSYLCRFGELFRYTEFHEQNNLFQMYRNNIEKRIISLEERQKNETKIYFVLSAMLGMFVIIVFI